MSEDLPQELKKVVSRGVIFAKSPHPKEELTINELLFNIRPWWSKVGANEIALPGGKINPEDLPENFNLEDLEDLERIYKTALIRELGEELGEEIETLALAAAFYFIGLFENNAWQSAVFAVELSEKPKVDVKAESAGTLWIPEEQLREKKVKLFADHQIIVDAAFAKLDEIKARHQNQDKENHI